MKVKVISLPYIFQVLYVLCFTRPRYQVSVYRTIGPLVSNYVQNYALYLQDSPPEPAFSMRILIGIGILIAIAIPGILCVLFKYMKVRRWSKRQDEGEEEVSPGSLQPLRRFPIGTSSESTNRYSSMPTGEDSSTPTHTHTCIIGK